MVSKVAQKAGQFAIRIVNADKYLSPEKKEVILVLRFVLCNGQDYKR